VLQNKIKLLCTRRQPSTQVLLYAFLCKEMERTVHIDVQPFSYLVQIVSVEQILQPTIPFLLYHVLHNVGWKSPNSAGVRSTVNTVNLNWIIILP